MQFCGGMTLRVYGVSVGLTCHSVLAHAGADASSAAAEGQGQLQSASQLQTAALASLAVDPGVFSAYLVLWVFL